MIGDGDTGAEEGLQWLWKRNRAGSLVKMVEKKSWAGSLARQLAHGTIPLRPSCGEPCHFSSPPHIITNLVTSLRSSSFSYFPELCTVTDPLEAPSAGYQYKTLWGGARH